MLVAALGSVAAGVMSPVGAAETAPALERLTLGEVKPAGWLRDWCETADPSFRTDYRLDPKTALASAKVVRTPMPEKWNWPFDAPVRIAGVTAADGSQLVLIPYGCTRLRMTMFPEPAASSGCP